MRTLQTYVNKYGLVAGEALYRALQSQAAHAGVGARLKRKAEALDRTRQAPLPLFDAPLAVEPLSAPIPSA